MPVPEAHRCRVSKRRCCLSLIFRVFLINLQTHAGIFALINSPKLSAGNIPIYLTYYIGNRPGESELHVSLPRVEETKLQ